MPAQFTKERPPVNFTQVKHHTPLSEHPLGARLPRRSGKLEVFDFIEPWRSDLGNDKGAVYLADWIYTDRAQLGLHIVTFTDATFVTLNWLHTFFDAMSRRTLLSAWTAMLEGREHDVPEFWGYDSNPIDEVGAPLDEKASVTQREEFVLKDKLVKGPGMWRFLYNYIWELVFYPEEEGRVVCMPAAHLEKLRTEAYKDLESAPSELVTMNTSDPSNPKPFLSDGDILCAWVIRLIALSNPNLTATSATNKTMLVMNVFGLRDILSRSTPDYGVVIPKDKAYIANCVAAIFSLFTMHDFLSLPLGHVAARIRKDLTVQGTRAQVEAGQRIARENESPLYGDGNMTLSAFSNWSRARLFETDFSAAIVKEAEREAGGARGKPRYIQPDATSAKGMLLRGSANCIGKDHEGNHWFGVLSRKQFAANLDTTIESLR